MNKLNSVWCLDVCEQENPASGKRDSEDSGEQRNSDRSSPDAMRESEVSEDSDQELDIEEDSQLSITPQLWVHQRCKYCIILYICDGL